MTPTEAKAMTTTATNGFDQELVRDLVGQIESHLVDLLSERGVYMAKCKAIRARIGEVYEVARDRGVDKKALRQVIHTRELERKIEDSIAKLEADTRETYEMLEAALGDFGDTPLGAAALSAKRAQEQDGIDLPPQ